MIDKLFNEENHELYYTNLLTLNMTPSNLHKTDIEAGGLAFILESVNVASAM